MNRKKAYRSRDFSAQERSYNRTFRALEDNLLSYTLWNYTADNTNDYGDMWNAEDLSLFSRDQQSNPGEINSGGRALKAVLRPFPFKVAGEPLVQEFDYRNGHFVFEFKGDSSVTAPSEFYLPNLQYPHGCDVLLSDGTFTLDRGAQLLTYTAGGLAVHRIEIKRK